MIGQNRVQTLEVDLGSSPIDEWYIELESRFDIETTQDEKLRFLCDAKDNLDSPIHSWFNLKEAFSARFPDWVISLLSRTYGFVPKLALDPFCGGGTTVIALSQQGIGAVGVEYNPFIAFIAKAKSLWPVYDLDEIKRALRGLRIDVPTGVRMAWPKLTTLKNSKYFRRDDVRTILFTLEKIERLKRHDLTKQFLRLGVAAAIDDVANLRKDGRALRYVKKESRPSSESAILNHCKRNLIDIKNLQTKQCYDHLAISNVWNGNALNLKDLRDPLNGNIQKIICDSSFDLILYSPPYLNNFDYSEVYKLELWVFGFINNYQQWRDIRRSTIRSHHSLKFEETSYLRDDPATDEVYRNLKFMGDSDLLKRYAKENMPSVILGYFDDMYLALKEQYRVLKPGGYLVYLVANSRHSDLPVATDVILGEVARLLGFEPLKLIVLHKRNGRTRKKRFLRESVVILRKPKFMTPSCI